MDQQQLKEIRLPQVIVDAAIKREEAQKALEFGAKMLEPSWTMRALQASVNEADAEIRRAAKTLIELRNAVG